jgi:isopenicillin N synthase-like dioxygenase
MADQPGAALHDDRGPQLPVIDLSRFIRGSPSDRAAVASAWDAAFRSTGFCLLIGFGDLLPAEAVSALRQAAFDFFGSPAAVKQACTCDGQVGYVGLGQENVSATSGTPSAAPDIVESLNLPAYQEEGSEWTMREAIEGERCCLLADCSGCLVPGHA